MDKKGQIAKVALELFTSKGYNQTSIQEIADASGVAQTTVLYHYKSKLQLLSAIIDETLKHIAHFDRSETNEPFDALKAYIRANLEWAYTKPNEAHVLLMLFNFTKSDAKLKTKATELIDHGRQRVFSFLKNMNLDREDHDLKETARVIQQYINAVMFQILVREDSERGYHLALENLDETLNRLIRI